LIAFIKTREESNLEPMESNAKYYELHMNVVRNTFMLLFVVTHNDATMRPVEKNRKCLALITCKGVKIHYVHAARNASLRKNEAVKIKAYSTRFHAVSKRSKIAASQSAYDMEKSQ